MLDFNIMNEDEIAKSDFLSKAQIQGYKTYSQELVKAYIGKYQSLLEKSEFNELSEEEGKQLKIFKSELESLKKVTVVNDDLKKEVMFYRTPNEIEKAAGHKYFKRKKTASGWKYYYTEAEYKKAKGGGDKETSVSKREFTYSDAVKQGDIQRKFIKFADETGNTKLKELVRPTGRYGGRYGLTPTKIKKVSTIIGKVGTPEIKKLLSDYLEIENSVQKSEEEPTLFKALNDGLITEETFEKANHKYFKREPKAGGGYKYYYTEAQCNKEKGKGKKEESKTGNPFSGKTLKSGENIEIPVRGGKVKEVTVRKIEPAAGMVYVSNKDSWSGQQMRDLKTGKVIKREEIHNRRLNGYVSSFGGEKISNLPKDKLDKIKGLTDDHGHKLMENPSSVLYKNRNGSYVIETNHGSSSGVSSKVGELFPNMKQESDQTDNYTPN